MNKVTTNNYLKGAMVLSFSAIIVKVLSAVYRIPYQDLTGDIGLYVYQQLYPFYALFVVLSGTAFPMLLTKYMAKASNKIEKEKVRALFYWICIMGVLCFVGLQSLKYFIAEKLGSISFVNALELISFFYLLMPFLAFLRSNLQSNDQVFTIAKGNVIEQTLRVGSILIVAIVSTFISFNYYDIGYFAMLGSFIASIVSVHYFTMRVLQTNTLNERFWQKVSWQSMKVSGHTFMRGGLAFAITSLVIVLFQFVDSVSFIPLLLKENIILNDIQVAKGIYDRSQPLIQLGSVVGASFSLAIIPMIVKLKQRHLQTEMQNEIKRALWIAIVLSCAASIGMVSIIGTINEFLFEDTLGTGLLAINCLCVCFTGYILAATAVLHGAENSRGGGRIILIGALVKFVFLGILVEKLGVYAFAISNLIGYGCIAIWLGWMIRKTFNITFFQGKFFRLTFTMLIMSMSVIVLQNKVLLHIFEINSGRLEASLLAIIASVFGVVVFCVLMLFFQLFEREHLIALPFGSKFIKFLKE